MNPENRNSEPETRNLKPEFPGNQTLLSEGDESADAELDFDDFVYKLPNSSF
jgi:hypothetical protein